MKTKRKVYFKEAWVRKAHNNVIAARILIQTLMDKEYCGKPYTEAQREALKAFKDELKIAAEKGKKLCQEMCL